VNQQAIRRRPTFCCELFGLCHSNKRAVRALFLPPDSSTGSPCPRRRVQGLVMTSWYPGRQIAAAWLLTVAVAAAVYFVPVTRLVEVLIPAEITADAD
jgi:hypothetical protein